MSRETEPTQGGDQTLIDGVSPITLRDRLSVMAASAMTPKRNPNAPQYPCDHGLFDEVGRAQLDLVDLIAQHSKENDQ